jgi:hypothetical protein
MTGGFFQNLPKLNALESILLVVVVLVFCFIGLLAASVLFDFDLPLNFLISNKPSLTAEPPYPGVFLYENDIYFDIQQHEGVPKQEEGIPTSNEEKPIIVFWQSAVDLEEVQLVYETGAIIPFATHEGKRDAILIQPQSPLILGLYCFQQSSESPDSALSYYWCFRVTEPISK